MNTKEIVALTEKWLNELKELAIDYNYAISDIAATREDYVKQTKKWYIIVLPYAVPILTIIILLIAFGIIIHIVGCPNPIDIKFQELELTQRCK